MWQDVLRAIWVESIWEKLTNLKKGQQGGKKGEESTDSWVEVPKDIQEEDSEDDNSDVESCQISAAVHVVLQCDQLFEPIKLHSGT